MTLSSCNTDVTNLFYQRVIVMLLVMHYLWSSISVHLCNIKPHGDKHFAD